MAAFIGRMKSSSYTPKEGVKAPDVLVAAAGELFSKYEGEGRVEFTCQTTLYLSVVSGN